MGNYSTVKSTPGFQVLTKNLLWEQEQMESVTCLLFQVLFSEDGNQAKDTTDLPHVTLLSTATTQQHQFKMRN